MQILMTGGTGYLGSRLLARLLSQPLDYQVTLVKRSFSDIKRINLLLSKVQTFDLDHVELAEIFETKKYDTILHCATDYGRKEVARSDMIEANLLLPLRLLENGIANGVKNFVNTDTLLDKRVSAYALSKRQFREWLEGSAHSINSTTVLLEHFYGPGDDKSKFVMSIIKALLNGDLAIPLTPGEQRRDFIYIDDVVEAFVYILKELKNSKYGYKEYEIGSGNSISIKEFVELAKTACNNQTTILEFGALPYRPHEPMDINVIATEIRALGWHTKIDLAEGIRRTIEFERLRTK